MASIQVIRKVLRLAPWTALAATVLLAGCNGSDDSGAETHSDAVSQQAQTPTPSSALARTQGAPPRRGAVLPPRPSPPSTPPPLPAPLPSPSMSSATLSWLAPTLNSNGSALTDLVGYRIYYGTDPTALTSNVTLPTPVLNTYVIEELRVGATYYFAVAALASDGTESVLSAVVSKLIS